MSEDQINLDVPASDAEEEEGPPTVFTYFEIAWEIILYLSTIALIVLTIVYWRDLTICYQRELAILCCCAIYWRFSLPKFPGVIWEVFQFTILLWVGLLYNRSDQTKDEECLDPQGSVILYSIHIIYVMVTSSYTVSCIVFVLLLIVALIMMLINHFIIMPRRRRRRGLRQLQFDQLEEIEFKKEENGVVNEQHMCSICLIDFNEDEKIIRLPICNHYFHKECLRQWLQTNGICPYCRADIKANLREWKRMKNRNENGGNGEVEMARQDSENSERNRSASLVEPLFDE